MDKLFFKLVRILPEGHTFRVWWVIWSKVKKGNSLVTIYKIYKIVNLELKAAVELFKRIVNRPDFTNQKFEQILKQGRQFLDEEMKKVLSD